MEKKTLDAVSNLKKPYLPQLYQKIKNNTQYSVNLICIERYNRMQGFKNRNFQRTMFKVKNKN